MTKRKYKIGIASDMQVGSIFGLLPPGFASSQGQEVKLNGGQVHLWKCWENFCARLKPLDLDILVINGDVVEGKQPKSRGSELCLPLMADQVEAAEEVLKPLLQACPNAIYYICQGTEYHVGEAGEQEEKLAKALGFSRYSGLGSGKYCKEVLDLQVLDEEARKTGKGGVNLNIAHHVSVTAGLYKAVGIDREGAMASLATHDKIHCVVRSHVHNFAKTEYRRRHNVICPCWQLQTRFMRHKSVYKMIPELGGLVIHVDNEAAREGEDPIFVQKIMYDLPVIQPVRPVLR